MPDQTPSTADILAQVTGATEPEIALQGPVWLLWRHRGRKVVGGWYEAATLAQALAQLSRHLAGRPADGLEICLSRDWQRILPADLPKLLPNSISGRIGLSIRLAGREGDTETRIAPLVAIANNRPPLREIDKMAQDLGMTVEALLQKAVVQRFTTEQFLVRPEEDRCTRLYRGGDVISPSTVGPELLRDTIESLSDWMRANLREDGRMTYKYWPSSGKESPADNTVRQFMATVALGRIAKRSGLAADAEAARRNLSFNLGKYYTEIDGRGAVILDGKAKLGAMAIAALAWLEYRQAGLIDAQTHLEEYNGLMRGIAYLHQEDGAFRTFLAPEDRNDNQNFYPGEALLYLAARHREDRDPALAKACLASFRYYRDWHRAQPNPAFVPWHSQAYVMLHEDLATPELADFVFERNDWLLEMQQWGGSLAPDLWGRFYNPKRPDFGPPHASSTGVYMEGLADAWRLARRLGDTARADAYALALRRGLRSIRQLQFRDNSLDGYYISRPRAVMGGVRTEVYNNEIRVDNVQHCLLALLKIEAEPDFPWTGCEAAG
ncbi:hypothetical protein Q9295_03200 [Xinfangfangia sp. CPCC 101601]|uniref:N-acylglucosamine 2-epimerase n=1 Tax=Pseudogemmobacter lacusdianii TaxID=3069608 RepID=A0ABU0VUG3_9RHOB|nr:hypothetical protein [Xinfangfangia sp. CPCC 101601]MDQ2065369.1 hypothetical protein [Xinfangfangia sp. CPCC 101601]